METKSTLGRDPGGETAGPVGRAPVGSISQRIQGLTGRKERLGRSAEARNGRLCFP